MNESTNITELMIKLKYLNQYARILKAKETDEFIIESFLINEEKECESYYEDEVLITKEKIRRLIYRKYNKTVMVEEFERVYQLSNFGVVDIKTINNKEFVYSYNKNEDDYHGLHCKREKINSIENFKGSYQDLYDVKIQALKKLFELEIVYPSKYDGKIVIHDNFVLLRYNQLNKYHIPYKIFEEWIDFEERQEYEEILNSDETKENKYIKKLPSIIRITPNEIDKLIENIIQLTRPIE